MGKVAVNKVSERPQRYVVKCGETTAWSDDALLALRWCITHELIRRRLNPAGNRGGKDTWPYWKFPMPPERYPKPSRKPVDFLDDPDPPVVAERSVVKEVQRQFWPERSV